MCQFFSFVMNDAGKIFYFDKEQRLEFKKDSPEQYENDSHASICDFYGLNEDEVNKYEYLKELVEDTKQFDLNKKMQETMDSFLEREFPTHVEKWIGDDKYKKIRLEDGEEFFIRRVGE